VTAVSVRPEQNLNIENEKKLKILAAAGIVTDEVEKEFSKIETLYVDFASNQLVQVENNYDHIKASASVEASSIVPKDQDIAILKRRENIAPIYVWYSDEEQLQKVVLPIRGYGLWGTLYGYISLDADLNTVKGIEYYDHKETPGLGGEVDNPVWKSDWNGKKIYDTSGEVILYVTKGPSSEDYEIDGISGATLTSNGVTNMIRYWLGENGYGPVLQKLREGITNV
jgi:Na+-transporting NADH:ubiquinone oxidoreductase subunit C